MIRQTENYNNGTNSKGYNAKNNNNNNRYPRNNKNK